MNPSTMMTNFISTYSILQKRWLYTFYRPSGGINSEEEYIVSKSILMGLLDSCVIKSKFTDSSIDALKEYILSVTAVDNNMLSYLFMDQFDLEKYSNSDHEGTNSAFAVKPNMSIGKSVHNLVLYDRQVFVEHSAQCINNMKGTSQSVKIQLSLFYR